MAQVIESNAEPRSQFARRVGVDAKALGDALAKNTPTLSYLGAARMGEVLSIPYLDFFPPDPRQPERLRSQGLSIPREHAGQPQGGAWARFGIEQGLGAALLEGLAVVVYAPEGSGKSSLGAATAERLQEHFERGIVWLDQRATANWRQAQARISMGLRFVLARADGPHHDASALEVPAAEFARYFWSRRRLLVVDNARDAGFVRELCGLHHLRAGRAREHTPLLIFTDNEAVAAELSIHDRFKRFDLQPIDRKAVRAHLSMSFNGAAGDDASTAAAALTDENLEQLVVAIAGKPAGLRLATELLSRDPHAVEDVRRTLLLDTLAPDTQRLILTIRALDDAQFPAAWARAMFPELSPGEFADSFATLCHGLFIETLSDDRFRVHAHLRGQIPASLEKSGLRWQEQGHDRMLEHARFEMERLGHDIARARSVVVEWPRLWELCLDALLDAVDSRADARGDTVALDIYRHTVINALVAWRGVLPRWSRPAVDRWLRHGVRLAEESERPLAHAQLLCALARWLAIERGDYLSSAPIFEKAINVAAEVENAGSPEEVVAAILTGSRCRIELGRSCYVVGRAQEGDKLFQEALDMTLNSGTPPTITAQNFNTVALTATRRAFLVPDHPEDGRQHWLRAENLLSQGHAVASGLGRHCGSCLNGILELNLSMVRFVLAGRQNPETLRAPIERMLSPQRNEIGDTPLLATAIECQIDVTGEGISGQTERCAELWTRALDCPDERVNTIAYRLGQTLFYVFCAGAPLREGPQPVAEGTAITDHGIRGQTTCAAIESCFLLYTPGPMSTIFDDAFLERAASFYACRATMDHRGEEILGRLRAARAAAVKLP